MTTQHKNKRRMSKASTTPSLPQGGSPLDDFPLDISMVMVPTPERSKGSSSSRSDSPKGMPLPHSMRAMGGDTTPRHVFGRRDPSPAAEDRPSGSLVDEAPVFYEISAAKKRILPHGTDQKNLWS